MVMNTSRKPALVVAIWSLEVEVAGSNPSIYGIFCCFVRKVSGAALSDPCALGPPCQIGGVRMSDRWGT
jgi:hypothetical protein